MQTGILDQTATVQRIVNTIGVDGSTTSNLVHLVTIILIGSKFGHGFTIHNRNTIEHNIIAHIFCRSSSSLLPAVNHMIHLSLLLRFLDVTREDSWLLKLPWVYQSIHIVVCHVVLVALTQNFLDKHTRAQGFIPQAGKTFCSSSTLRIR